MQKQLGGTLIGLIIGLLIGLAVALGVAMYVTKAPIPLMDRGVTRKPDQDAQEKERNKDWNPNAGLGSKSVPAPNGAESEAAAPTPPTQAPAAPVAPAAPTAESKPAAPAAKPATGASKSADPLGDLMQSRAKEAPPADKTASSDPAADPFAYYVQAGAFRSPDEAESQRAKLAMMGFDAKITEREQAGKPVYRVRVGPFGKKVEADIMQERLKGQNVDTALVRVQR